MYAIIETGGKQYWVKPGQDLQVEKLDAKAGDTVELKYARQTDGEYHTETIKVKLGKRAQE